MKKGQMFIIAAIIVSISLIMLKAYFGIYPIIEEGRFLLTESLVERTENINNEYKNIMNVALQKKDFNYTSQQLYNFSEYVRTKENAKIFYMYAYTNSSMHEIKVIVVNFLGDSINLFINASDTVHKIVNVTNVMDWNTVEMTFYTLPQYTGTINITIEYEIQHETVKEKVIIDSSKDNEALFYDFSLASSSSETHVKEFYNPIVEQMIELPGSQHDSGEPFCGDSICNMDENCPSCFIDCCTGECGNDVCEGYFGENCNTCSADCDCPEDPPCLPPKCGKSALPNGQGD